MRFPLDDMRSGSRGAALLEWALVAPVILMLLFGALYFGFAVSVRGMVDHAAHQGLELAAVLPELEELPVGGMDCANPDNAEAEFCVGYRKVQQKIYDALAPSFVAKDEAGGRLAYLTGEPVIDFPLRSENQTSAEAYAATPIGISMYAALRPRIPWFDTTLSFAAKAAGYRETRNAVSYPVPVDCNGNPYGSAEYDSNPCLCQAPSFYWADPTVPKEAINNNTGGWTCRTCNQDAYPVPLSPSGAPGDSLNGVAKYSGSLLGCYCPTAGWCYQNYGVGHGGVFDSGGNYKTACRCACLSILGGIGGTGSCSCKNPPPMPGYPTGTLVATGPNPQGSSCGCMVRPADNPTATPRPFDLTDCQAQYPDLTVKLTESKCGCLCDAYAGCNFTAPGGIFTIRENYRNPQDRENGCKCTCKQRIPGGSKTAGWLAWDEASKTCVCPSQSCPAGQKMDLTSCTCKCAVDPRCELGNGTPDLGGDPCKCVDCNCGYKADGTCIKCESGDVGS